MDEEIYYLDKEDVLIFHKDMLMEYGGLPGIKDEGKIESILAQPCGSYAGIEYYPELFSKAAAYLFYFATGHSFVDVNKRVGYMCAWTFLAINGHNVQANPEEAYKMVKHVVRLGESIDGKPPMVPSDELIRHVSIWLEHHAGPLSPYEIEKEFAI